MNSDDLTEEDYHAVMYQCELQNAATTVNEAFHGIGGGWLLANQLSPDELQHKIDDLRISLEFLLGEVQSTRVIKSL